MTWCRQYHALPYTGFPVQVGLFISQGDVTVPGHGMSHTNTIFTSFHPSHQSPKVHLPQCVVSLSISSPSPTHMGPHPPLSPFILLLFPLFHSLSLSPAFISIPIIWRPEVQLILATETLAL